MIIEQLLETSLEELEKMSDKELTDHLSHYFVITRPEQVSKSSNNKTSLSINFEHRIKIERAKALAKAAGVDLGFD